MPNIFIESNVMCPSCKAPFVLRYPNPKVYVAAGRDSDQRVTAYTWAQGIKTDEIPHYYAVGQCPQCLFADFRENFENPKSGPKESKLYEARKNLDLKRVLILRKLRRLVPEGKEDKMTLIGAMSLHIAAIYVNQLPEKQYIDQNKLGRLYLRLSWLYREQKGNLSPDMPPPSDPFDMVDQKKPEISQTVEKLGKIVEGIQGYINCLGPDLAAIRNLVQTRCNELNIQLDAENNPYIPIVSSLEHKSTEFQTMLDMLQQSVSNDKKGFILSPTASSAALDQYDDEETQELLNELSMRWAEFPISESLCLRRAVEALDMSIKYEDAERSTEQSLAILNLLITLLQKIGDLNYALEYINEMLKNGSREKQGLMTRLNQGKANKSLTLLDEKNIQRKIATINTAMTQGIENRQTILELIYKRDKDKILAILKANLSQTAAEQERAITTAGFPESLIIFLRDKGLIKIDDPKKKSGWFGKK